MHRKDVDSMAKKKSKRGFTLVELIVVLVILAILAALLIPALTGYIDKAKKSQVVAETRAGCADGDVYTVCIKRVRGSIKCNYENFHGCSGRWKTSNSA